LEPKIIFDVATKPFFWQQIWAAAGAFAFGCAMFVVRRLKWRHAPWKGWGYFMIAAAITGACYATARWYVARRGSLRTLRSGQYEVLQGRAENFHPMPNDGSSDESFTIAGRTFSYSDWHSGDPTRTTACFDQTKPHGGPIHEGMFLRVEVVGRCILRIEELPEGSTAAQTER
jgi:hypothetical protein